MTSDTPLTIADQIAQLKNRGMSISSDDAHFLYDNNYYRLSIYWRNRQVDPTRGQNSFEPGTQFSEIKNIYRFERALRSTLIDGLMAFEMTLKARMAYELAHLGGGPFSYLSPDLYKDDVGHNADGTTSNYREELLESLNSDIRRSKDLFITHYQNVRREVPVWAGIEVASFGTVSKMYALIADERLREKLTKGFNQLDSDRFAANIYSLSNFRNICAHGGRIWNRRFHVTPSVKKILRRPEVRFESNSAWARILVLTDLLRSIDPNSFEAEQIDLVLEDFPEYQEGLMRPLEK